MKPHFTVVRLVGFVLVTLLLTGCVSPNIPIVPIIKYEKPSTLTGDDSELPNKAENRKGSHLSNQVS